MLEFEPPVRLVFSFTDAGFADVAATCTRQLEEAKGGTILSFSRDGFEKVGNGAFCTTAEHDMCWDQHFAKLRRLAS